MAQTRSSAGGTRLRVSVVLLASAIIGLSACATVTPSPPMDDARPVERDTEPELQATTPTQPDVPTSVATPVAPAPVVDVEAVTTVGSVAAAAVDPAPVEPASIGYVPPAAIQLPPVDPPLVAVGKADGGETARIQGRLLELGFWLQAVDGNYGSTTSQAVMAFQKYHGIDATAAVDEQTAAVLSAAGERASGRADAGALVEIDKSRQLLFIVADGAAVWTINSSTGSEIPYEAVNDKDPTKVERGDAVTPVGFFHTERERPDGWWAGDLGEIYRPKYFIGGIAVHGSNSIPKYPASHGCVRVSVSAMDFIWDSNLMPLGINVWVHGEIPAD